MAIKLLRESSETPNISNKDDVRMVRYAYGGYDGIVKSYGEELAASATGSSLHIGSGRVVLDGWEADIDGAGVDIDLSSMSSGVYYYTAYLEVNAELETAEVKTLYDTATYPSIDSGDDLTEASSGTARLALHRFKVSYGTISDIVRGCMVIPYGKEDHDSLLARQQNFENSANNKFNSVDSKLSSHTSQISSIEARLSKLGFRQGSCSVSGASSVQVNSLKRQGNYVIMNLTFSTTGSFYVNIPSGFRPSSSIEIPAIYDGNSATGNLGTNGYLNLTGIGQSGTVRFLNIGWETADS